MPLRRDICEASQLLHFEFSAISNQEKKKNRLQAVSQDLFPKKKLLVLEFFVDCSGANDDDNYRQRSHGLEVSRYCEVGKLEKSWKMPRVDRANW